MTVPETDRGLSEPSRGRCSSHSGRPDVLLRDEKAVALVAQMDAGS